MKGDLAVLRVAKGGTIDVKAERGHGDRSALEIGTSELLCANIGLCDWRDHVLVGRNGHVINRMVETSETSTMRQNVFSMLERSGYGPKIVQ